MFYTMIIYGGAFFLLTITLGLIKFILEARLARRRGAGDHTRYQTVWTAEEPDYPYIAASAFSLARSNAFSS
jgi:hypothetical protein